MKRIRPERALWSTSTGLTALFLASRMCGPGGGVSGLVPRVRRESRYFTSEFLMPPLDPVETFFGPLQSPSDFSSELPIAYTNDPRTVSQWLADHVPSDGCTLGFDVESVPEMPWIKRKATFFGAATVQLATPHAALVVHLARPNGRASRGCGPILEAVLGDEKIIKAGCGVDQDMLELRAKWPGFEARSRFDLGGIKAPQRGTPGLKKLAHTILGVDLPKSRRLATSNWSQVPLPEPQLVYAARDAWAGAAIAAALEECDPDSFRPRSLCAKLSSQRSLSDLQRRQSQRKQAKSILTAMYAYMRLKDGDTREEDLPKWKSAAIKEVRDVIKKNQFEPPDELDIEALGFVFAENQLALNFTNS